MKRGHRFFAVVLILFLLVPLTWLIWSGQPARSSGEMEGVAAVTTPISPTPGENAAAAVETLVPTALPLPPTNTPLPPLTATPTAAPTDTPTPRPTSTATSTPSPTVSPVIIPDNIDRTCPNPAPLRPEYDRYFVPAQSWPFPGGEGGEHFWLSHPFEGGGRLLYTDWFPYGYDVGGRYLIHNGVDVSEPLGTPILAMASGTVVVAGDDFNRLYGWRCDWYGHLVVVELDDRWLDQPVYVLYGHVLNISVTAGQRVSQGEQVAEVGIGGAATLPHLHFEVRIGTNEFGSTRNPLLWVSPSNTRGLIAGRIVDPEGRPWQGVAVNAVGQSEETEDYTTWTYLGDPDNLMNPDEVLAENFVIGDMRPGRYQIVVLLEGVEYHAEVEVRAGELSTVEIITEPLKTATPQPTPTQEPENTPEPFTE